MEELIEEDEIESWMKKVPEWEADGSSITRTVEYDEFMDAIDFVNGVAEVVEEAQHYPEITVSGCNVIMKLETGDDGGVTALDFELASRIDNLLD